MPVTRVLGIDPANRTGFAHSDGYRGFIDLARAADQHPGERLIRFSNWLEETLDTHVTELIAAEDASFGSNNPHTAAQHNQLKALILLIAAEFGLPVKFFQPTTIKAFATGSGSAGKDQMKRACKTFHGIDIADENVADAFWIMELAKRPDCWPKPGEKQGRRAKKLPPRSTNKFQRRMF